MLEKYAGDGSVFPPLFRLMRGPSENPLKRLVGEVHRRSLWQVLAIYIVASWVALQVVDVLVDNFGLPEWFPAFALALLVIGLPIVLATAFIQEGGPERSSTGSLAGLDDIFSVKEVPAASQPSGLRALFTWRNAIAGGLLAFALWGVVATGWLLLVRGAMAGGTDARDSGPSAASIAVLPFDNIGSDPGTQGFTDGMHDELIAQLAKVESLKVISRTSVLEYRNTEKNLRDIARELGVGTVLEGSVRRGGDRVRVTVQLIDAETDQHLWAESYDRRLSDVLTIQSDVALEISRALDAALSPEQRERIAALPTRSAEAYELYLKGRDLLGASPPNADEWDRAVAFLEAAVALDPEFALAHGLLSQAESEIHWFAIDRSEHRMLRAREAAERALQIEPELPEAHLAMANYLYRSREYDEALEEVAVAAQGLPGSDVATRFLAWIQRRTGRMVEAARSFARLVELNPRSARIAWDAGNTFERIGDYGRAEEYFRRAIDLEPEWRSPYVALIRTFVARDGDTRAARGVLEEARSRMGETALVGWEAYLDVLDRRFGRALELLAERPAAELSESQYTLSPWGITLGRLHAWLGDPRASRAAFDSARIAMDGVRAQSPDDPRVHMGLALTLAGLGRTEEAIVHAEEAARVMPPERDFLFGNSLRWDLAEVYAQTGRAGVAVDVLADLLAVPSRMNPNVLRLDPVWDPLREHPDFQALLEHPVERFTDPGGH